MGAGQEFDLPGLVRAHPQVDVAGPPQRRQIADDGGEDHPLHDQMIDASITKKTGGDFGVADDADPTVKQAPVRCRYPLGERLRRTEAMQMWTEQRLDTMDVHRLGHHRPVDVGWRRSNGIVTAALRSEHGDNGSCRPC